MGGLNFNIRPKKITDGSNFLPINIQAGTIFRRKNARRATTFSALIKIPKLKSGFVPINFDHSLDVVFSLKTQ